MLLVLNQTVAEPGRHLIGFAPSTVYRGRAPFASGRAWTIHRVREHAQGCVGQGLLGARLQ